MKTTLGAWFNHLLFKLLPPKLYLRSQGIKWHSDKTTATVTYRLPDGAEKSASVKCDVMWLVKTIIPLWLEHGFCEPVPELSPYIPRHLDNKRYYILPHDILKVEWWDPVLEDYFCMC